MTWRGYNPIVMVSATVAISTPLKIKRAVFCARSTGASASIMLQYGKTTGEASTSMSLRCLANLENTDRTIFEEFMCTYLEVVSIDAIGQLIIEVE